jgi:hypothetical protein
VEDDLDKGEMIYLASNALMCILYALNLQLLLSALLIFGAFHGVICIIVIAVGRRRCLKRRKQRYLRCA